MKWGVTFWVEDKDGAENVHRDEIEMDWRMGTSPAQEKRAWRTLIEDARAALGLKKSPQKADGGGNE